MEYHTTKVSSLFTLIRTVRTPVSFSVGCLWVVVHLTVTCIIMVGQSSHICLKHELNNKNVFCAFLSGHFFNWISTRERLLQTLTLLLVLAVVVYSKISHSDEKFASLSSRKASDCDSCATYKACPTSNIGEISTEIWQDNFSFGCIGFFTFSNMFCPGKSPFFNKLKSRNLFLNGT